MHFLLSASIDIDCGGTVAQVTTPGSVIQTPDFPSDYLNNQDCKAVIQLAQGERVLIEFLSFNVPFSGSMDCPYDWLEIRDGNDSNADLLLKACYEKKPSTIVSSGNSLHLHFHSDHKSSKVFSSSGFLLKVRTPGMQYFFE